MVYGLAGRKDKARKFLKELEEIAPKMYVRPSSFVHAYLGLGEMEECFNWREKAIDEHDGFIFNFHLLAYFDPLRSHPRYPAMLRKMNLMWPPPSAVPDKFFLLKRTPEQVPAAGRDLRIRTGTSRFVIMLQSDILI